jgi:quercetin dioxygenase-like cupin family protein
VVEEDRMSNTEYFEEAPVQATAAGRIVSIEADLPQVALARGLSSRPLVGTNLLASFVRYEPHAVAPRHAHEEEQVFVVLEGELEITLGDEVRRVRAGEAALIPPWVPHTVRALDQPAYQLDVFSPPRKAMLAMLDALARGE